MKAAIIDGITPKGQTLNPHIPRNVKSDREFHHERTGGLLCPASYDWANSEYVFSFGLSAPTIISRRIKETAQWTVPSHGRSVAHILVCKLHL
jgi:hypothetical protein